MVGGLFPATLIIDPPYELEVIGSVYVTQNSFLHVDGRLTANDVNVDPGGTLAGNGTIAAGTITVDGTLAPGTSVGTLTLGGAGALALNGTLDVEIDNTGSADLLDGGTVNIGGSSTLALTPPTADPTAANPLLGAQEYTVVTATSAVGGTFATAPAGGDVLGLGQFAGSVNTPGSPPTFDPAVVYNDGGNNVKVRLFQALEGDSNLDSLVDVNDRITWNSNKFTTGKTWLEADWTGEGTVDVNDRIKWNSNKFTDYSAAAAAAGEPAAAPGDAPEFVYDATTGEMIVITNGHYMTEMVINFTDDQSGAWPDLLLNGSFLNGKPITFPRVDEVNYGGQWFAGAWQMFDNFSNGDTGDHEPNGAATNPDGQMLLLSQLPLGMGEADFGVVSWGDFDGAAGDEIVSIVPEPGTMLLLAGICSLLVWRRR
jgi:hypothetical protein